MTPKEKAKELVDKCKIEIYHEVPALQSNIFHLCIFKSAKHCALIAVDEILTVVKFYEKQNCRLLIDNMKVLYWQEVKQEIEKL
jgi:hypothetical protein